MQTQAEIGQGNTFGVLGTLCLKAPLFERVEVVCSLLGMKDESCPDHWECGRCKHERRSGGFFDLPDVQLDYRGFE